MKPTCATLCWLLLSGLFSICAQEAIKSPEGTERVFLKMSPEAAQKAYFPQAEEFCRKQLGDGSFVRHGPYVLWGPNGERLAEGQYKNDQKDGIWLHWRPSQVLEYTWKDGQAGPPRVLPQPTTYTIDFGVAAPHEYGIPAGLGSTRYKVLGKDGKFCRFEYRISLEKGQGAWVSCLVPTDVGKMTFKNTNRGLDFSALDKYIDKKVQSK